MGYPGPISNHFVKSGHKGELSAVFSAIYYLKSYDHIDHLACNR